MQAINFVPVGGTWGGDAPWATRDDDPFQQMMRQEMFFPVRWPDDAPFVWSGKLAGMWFMGIQEWHRLADALEQFLRHIPYPDRNLICHSHGGQGALILAARGFPLCSLTTVGTPIRKDIPADEAVDSIGMWQHVHDIDRDWTATMKRLGGLGDLRITTDRRFLFPEVTNVGLKGIRHSKILGSHIHLWRDLGLLDRIRGAVAVR